MADAVVGLVLEKSIGLLSETLADLKRFRVHNVKIQVEEIMSELITMKGYLKNADARERKEERVRQWVRDIKALAYIIEDVIETFDIRVELRNEMGTSERSFKRILKKIINFFDIIQYLASRDIQLEIDEIINKLTTLWQTKETYGISSYYPKSEEFLQRMGKEVDQLVLRMFGKGRNYQIICICGPDDMGRTLLVRQLLNHDKIRKCFKTAKVVIRQEITSRIVLEQTLSQWISHPEEKKYIRDMEESKLVETLRTYLKKDACLIALDSISSQNAWERLQVVFSGNSATKIIITTASLELAEIATAGKGLIHKMEPLSAQDAWTLFSQYVTSKDAPELNAVISEMENIGRNQVTQREVLTTDILALEDTLQQNEEIEGMRAGNVTTKYSGLAYQLKQCFFYLATFPKNTNIKLEKLCHLWMAEGLLLSGNYQSETMLVAETYLNELHRRGMIDFQKGVVTTARRSKSCSLPDEVYPYCLEMARHEEFFVVMGNQQELDSDASSWTDGTWRLVIYVGQHDNTKFLDRLNKKLRCLIVCNSCENQEVDTHEMLTAIMKCIMQSKYLRILDFNSIDFGNKTLPKKIADLVHLRYLSFTGCLLKGLPACIGFLPYLQILDLRVRSGCEIEIPNVLHKLKRLRHLYLPIAFRTRGGGKLRLDGLKFLETLENFNAEVCNVKDISELTEIQYLSVNIEGSHDSLKRSHDNLKRFVDHMNKPSDRELWLSLHVRNFDCYTEERHSIMRKLLICPALYVLHLEGHLGEIPPYYKISEKFTEIVLSGSELQYDPMPTLENLPNLRVLKLVDDALIWEEIKCSASKFPELRYLELSNLYALKSWRVEERAMSKLSTLKIENCSRLKLLPEGLQFLKNLQELKILRTPGTSNYRLFEEDGESSSELQIDPMPTLGKLPHLRVLILNNVVSIVKDIICSAPNFPELRHLELSNLSDLNSWRVEDGAMLKLSYLKIGNCSKLKMLPDGLRLLENLQTLKILRMPEPFKNSLRVVNNQKGANMDKLPLRTSVIFDKEDEPSE